ncbi:hypothetical protein BDF14DRAFT_1885134 [Spinellus fusiger]|nr:hypothetical protein BDF14DRAFT_1885134 [Spinellus fusiger]
MSRLRDTPLYEEERRGPVESFVVFGTAFPDQTEKDKRAGVSDAGQFVPVWKQEARDENGRRRFHGAFTGGFSAGYFNTVGSKEGWQPSNFVSSRSSRNENKEMKPEDYMDDEDRELMAGSRKLVATEEFDILGGTERELAARKKLQQEDESRGGSLGFLGSSIMNMIGPPKDSVGIRLLRKMGWKPGQGIGPRMSHKDRKQWQHKDRDSTAQQQPAEEEEEEEAVSEEEEAMANITFAPRDTPIVDFSTKKNTRGLGYDLEKSVPQVAEMRRLRELATQGHKTDTDRTAFGVASAFTQRAGFGLGTFEDDDDTDVYGDSGPQNIHHSLYDDELDQGEELTAWPKSNPPKYKRQPVEEPVTCLSDGREPLKGFVYSPESQELGQWYKPPKVPTDFDGRHAPSLRQDTAIARPQHDLSSDQRGNILGEKPIEARSVFDFIPARSKNQLDHALRFITSTSKPKDTSHLSGFTTVTKEVAAMALQGYMPFGDNMKKQTRYRDYLENCLGKKEENREPKEVLPIPEGMNYEDGMKELEEFAKAARIFRPISAMMSGRFTSASTTTVEQNMFGGGLKTEAQWRQEKKDNEVVVEAPTKELTQEAEAASMKMFGQLTRSITLFYPTNLVCKRFNVRNPHPHHKETTAASQGNGRTEAGSHQALSEESMDAMLRSRKAPAKPKQGTVDPGLSAIIPKPSDRSQDADAPTAPSTVETNTKLAEETPLSDAALDYERPSIDVFKAIFENSDDEEDEEDEETHQTNTSTKRSFMDQTRSAKKLPMEEEVEEDMIGPILPPSEILPPPLETTPSEPFRPMFNRATTYQTEITPSPRGTQQPMVLSEEIIVQPFKSRALQERNKRRHIDVSDEEETQNSEDERRERREKKSRKKHRHSHKRSRSRSQSVERSSRKDKKKSKKESSSSSRRRDHKHSSSKSRHTFNEEEAEWVEKEPVVISHRSHTHSSSDHRYTENSREHSYHQTDNRKDKEHRSRMRAADMW